MEKQFKHFAISIEDHIATLSINRPQKSNAFDETTWKELGECMQWLEEDTNLRCVILRGEGKNFSAGMDLSTLMGLPAKWGSDCEARKREDIRKFIVHIQDCISSIERCPVPVIASIHGACIGGALSIITACDMRYCSQDAYFSIRETQLGIVADIGVLQRMPYMLDPGMMAELSYTGRNFDASEAKSMGLVNGCYDSKDGLESHVTDIARKIASQSPLTVRGVKKMLLYKRDNTVADSLDHVALYNSAFLLSNDLMEAMSAYMEKRRPKF